MAQRPGPASPTSTSTASRRSGSRTATRSIVVAVIDDGVDFSHPDLAGAAWTNPGEIARDNGLDDDGNGYIDDIHGWDFCNDDNASVHDAGQDAHGTHVAGTIAASLNGSGVVGVAPGDPDHGRQVHR